MFILFTNLFLARPFRLENTLECYNLRGGQGGSTEVNLILSFSKSFSLVQCMFEFYYKFIFFNQCIFLLVGPVLLSNLQYDSIDHVGFGKLVIVH